MNNVLIGYSGFVGSNLTNYFDKNNLFNSRNINVLLNSNNYYDWCIYSGVKSEKFTANSFPNQDLSHILQSFSNIENIKAKKIVLISTVDVYGSNLNYNESNEIKPTTNNHYGNNRSLLESLVKSKVKDYHIIRLPALFGQNLKKNFIFDMLNPIPRKLSNKIFNGLKIKENILMENAYSRFNEEYYGINLNFLKSSINSNKLLSYLESENATSRIFTDSRSFFQFYNLKNLWADINKVIVNNIKEINFATEPIMASEIYYQIFNYYFKNHINENYPNYNIKTIHSNLWNDSRGYIYNKNEIINDIVVFYKNSSNK